MHSFKGALYIIFMIESSLEMYPLLLEGGWKTRWIYLISAQTFLKKGRLFESYWFDQINDVRAWRTIVVGIYDTNFLLSLIGNRAKTPVKSSTFFLKVPDTKNTGITVYILPALCNLLGRFVFKAVMS